MTMHKYTVEVTLTFKCNWFFAHNNMDKIQDAITRQYHTRIRRITKLMPMLQFIGYTYNVTKLLNKEIKS